MEVLRSGSGWSATGRDKYVIQQNYVIIILTGCIARQLCRTITRGTAEQSANHANDTRFEIVSAGTVCLRSDQDTTCPPL